MKTLSSSISGTSKPRRLLALSPLVVLMLAACGGDSDNTPAAPAATAGTPVPAPAPTPAPAPAPTPAPAPAPLVTSFCANSPRTALGADDPFYVNSWHLKNTGPTQSVSAASNSGLAGIDARVEAVHNGGLGCTGRGITVAINDSGLELAHEDLAANVVAGKSFNFKTLADDPNPAPREAKLDHGTGVAGVAVARGWNGRGSRGTAPFASVVGYVSVARPTPEIDYLAFGGRSKAGSSALVTQFGNRTDGVDIFNLSAGADFADPPTFEADDSMDAQTDAARVGSQVLRAGKGAVYFQSAGNGHREYEGSRRGSGPTIIINCATTLGADAGTLGTFSNLAATACQDSNHDPANKPFWYQVAAIHNTGMASSYSTSGAANWITGFGGEDGITDGAAIISTDNSSCTSGSNNVNNADKTTIEAVAGFVTRIIADLFGASPKDPNCNYTGRSNGTSAAAPSVSGVAALMLESNPNLTWRDVGFILAKTARKVDADIATGSRAPNFVANGGAATLALDLPWQTNSAGFNFQNRYGFGLVDATAAVNLAQNYTAPAGRRTTDLVRPVTGALTTTPVGTQYTRTERQVSFAAAGAVSGMMRADINLTNSLVTPLNPGMLQFELVNNTTGQTSILMPAFTGWYVGGKTDPIPANGVRAFRFHTNAFYGDSLAGNFTVRVTHVGGGVSFTSSLTSYSM